MPVLNKNKLWSLSQKKLENHQRLHVEEHSDWMAYWLVGLTDGHGNFSIDRQIKPNGHIVWNLVFEISLSKYNTRAIMKAKQCLGAGNITITPDKMITLRIRDRKLLRQYVFPIFDNISLLSNKYYDYARLRQIADLLDETVWLEPKKAYFFLKKETLCKFFLEQPIKKNSYQFFVFGNPLCNFCFKKGFSKIFCSFPCYKSFPKKKEQDFKNDFKVTFSFAPNLLSNSTSAPNLLISGIQKGQQKSLPKSKRFGAEESNNTTRDDIAPIWSKILSSTQLQHFRQSGEVKFNQAQLSEILTLPWVSGFIEAEGSFYICKKDHKRYCHGFGLSQSGNQLLLEALRKYLKIEAKVKLRGSYYLLDTTNWRTLKGIKDRFVKRNKLIGIKSLEFRIWERSMKHRFDDEQLKSIQTLLRNLRQC